MGALFANNASSSLASTITEFSTSLAVAPGDGLKFPAIGAGDWIMLTLVKLVAGEPVREIVRATAKNNDVFTIVRGQENTSIVGFAAGDKVSLNITAGVMNSKFDKSGGTVTGPVEFDGNVTVDAPMSVLKPVTMNDQEMSGAVLKDCGGKVATVPAPTGTVHTIDYRDGPYQVWSPPAGACTLNITNWPPAGINGELWIEGVNLGAATITTSVALDYLKPDGTYATTTSMNTNQGATLRTSGIDNVLIWGRQGAPKRAKVVR